MTRNCRTSPPNGEALRKCILSGPYKPTTVLVEVVAATDDSPAILEHTTVETPMNMSLANKAYFEAEKETIHLILTGIEDEIYSTVDACQTVHEMWEAIERLQQDWSRFVTIVKQQHKLDEVSYHKLFNILKQYQKEVNELRDERLARSANPLALVATAQANQDPYYQTSKSHKSYAPSLKPSILTRSHTTTRYKGKEIAKPVTPPSKTASEEDSDPKQAQRDKNINTCLVETDDSNVVPDSPDMCDDDIQNDQNDVESDDERVALANLIANLKLDVDENKRIQKQLKKANTTLAQELKEYKTILIKTSKTLGESNSVRDSCLVALQNKQTEFEKYKAFNDRTVDYDKLERKLNETLGQLAQKDIEIKEDKNIVISELKKLIEKGKGKSIDTKFDKPSVVRQPNAQRVPKPSVLEGLSKQVTAQTLPQTTRQAVSNTTMLKPGMYRIDNKTTQTRAPQLPQTIRNTNPRVSTSIEVNHKTNVSRPQHKSNQLSDKVGPNNSQVKVKKTQVEDHPRIPSISNKMKYVSACKDSLNSRTLNANAVCATCNKCLVDSNHFAYVTKMLNDVNARTKKPNIVQLILFIVDSGCTKHMTGNLKLLCNFVEKFLGTVRFGNDQFAPNLGYGDLVQGNITINKDVVIGLRKLKYVKDQLCSSCELSKAKRSSFKSKVVPSSKRRLNFLHMDLCGPMRVASINGKKYILVIVDDYSRYTWTLFLRSKDETPKVLKESLTMIQRNLQAPVITMKEKGDMYILVGYSTQSKGYRVYNKRTRLIVESIHIHFDEIKEVSETSVVNDTSADAHVPSQQELDLLFGPLYDKFLNAGSNLQDKQPTTNIQPISAPSTPTYVHAKENNDDQAEEEHLPDDEFTNPFCAPAQEVAESSSHNIDYRVVLLTICELIP
nr:Gag-Pol polyprotein [Tanacetum cinerariifolium]